MRIENPYDGMKEFVYENVCGKNECDVFIELNVTEDELISGEKNNLSKNLLLPFRRKDGIKYRVKAGEDLDCVAEKFSIDKSKISCPVESEKLFPCEIVYINKD